MYYVVISHTIYEFFSRSKAEKFYTDKEAEGLQPFATQDEDVAKLIAYDTNPAF